MFGCRIQAHATVRELLPWRAPSRTVRRTGPSEGPRPLQLTLTVAQVGQHLLSASGWPLHSTPSQRLWVTLSRRNPREITKDASGFSLFMWYFHSPDLGSTPDSAND